MGLLKALQKEDYRIVAIAPTDEYSQQIKDLGIEFYPITINNKGTNPIEDVILISRFFQLYKEIKPDVLLHYTIKPNIYGTIAARFAGIPVISNICGLGTVFLNDNFSSKLARLLYKIALQSSKKVFFQNEDDRMLFVKSKLVSKEKTELLAGSGVDTIGFAPMAYKKTNNTFSFLFIARLVKDKGLLEYIEAARQLKEKYPNVTFKILGSFYPGNPTAIRPEEVAQWEQENIIDYLGETDDVASVISQSDSVVLPSYREGLSRVLLEAASMAKPIVTTNVPGCRDVVDHGVNGFLCKVKDADDLAKQMEKMIQLEERERLEMGKNGRQKVVNNFSEGLVVDSYKKAIRSILGSSLHGVQPAINIINSAMNES